MPKIDIFFPSMANFLKLWAYTYENNLVKPLKILKMATNKPVGDNARKGAVKNRSQVLNPKTNLYVKRDSSTGRFMDVKTSGGKFKGVRNEK